MLLFAAARQKEACDNTRIQREKYVQVSWRETQCLQVFSVGTGWGNEFWQHNEAQAGAKSSETGTFSMESRIRVDKFVQLTLRYRMVLAFVLC